MSVLDAHHAHPVARRALLAGAAGTAAIAGLPVPASARPHRDPHAPLHDFRAMWIASVANIDWPSRPGLSAAEQQRELIAWFDLAVAQHHNAVVLQVRPTADAFWPSPYEPWSVYLTGTQGGDPGYDPLAFAVTEAHRRNLALHAWFNPYRISQGTDLDALVPEHPARQHPDWVISYGGKLYYDPGRPDVRRFVITAITDAVRRYDLDAVHFDDYFYPYPVAGQTFDDADTFATYGGGASLADWRRANIDALITGVRDALRRCKPWVQFGISPFAVWRNVATDPRGSDTTAGAQTYDDLYADTRRWVRDGWLDYVVPQVYWSRTFVAANYDEVTRWWADQVAAARRNGHRVGLYVGQATYKVAANADPAWDDPGELSSHLDFNATRREVQGNVWFSAKDVRADRLGATSLLTRTWYAHPALLPVVGRYASRGSGPQPVQDVRRRGATVSWRSGDADAVTIAIFALPGRPDRDDLADATHLAATVRRTGERQSWTDPAPAGRTTYMLVAVDRVGRTSRPVRVR